MFRFVVAMLVINSYSGSWGAPTQNVTMSLSESLNELARGCESPFLTTQMKNKIKDCEVTVPPYQKKQYECLLFYDINRRLCGAVAASKLALTEDHSSTILAEQDVSQLCNIAKDWTFTDMGALYNKTVQSVFHDPVKCFKFCIQSSDSILSVDSTFYCKYYKWGTEMLKSQIITKHLQDSTGIAAQVPSEVVSIKNVESANGENQEAEIEKPIQSNHDIEPLKPNITNQKNILNNTQSSTHNVNSEVIPTENKDGEISAASGNQQEHPLYNATIIKPVNEHIPAVIPAKFSNDQQPVVPKDFMSKIFTTSTVSQSGSNKKEDAGSDAKNNANQNVAINLTDNQKPSNNGDIDDYPPNDPDSEEVRDGLGDTQGGDDSDDALDTKLDDEISKKTVGIHEPPVYNNDIPPKETYSNTLPDFAEEDDHFFPFFLTAIIMVVLLYILYHNKNKVSKVFLGLIVEGRQPGRRRNSRGHAYRRLDTLEQAMSTNTAAPPSKIIY